MTKFVVFIFLPGFLTGYDLNHSHDLNSLLSHQLNDGWLSQNLGDNFYDVIDELTSDQVASDDHENYLYPSSLARAKSDLSEDDDFYDNDYGNSNHDDEDCNDDDDFDKIYDSFENPGDDYMGYNQKLAREFDRKYGDLFQDFGVARKLDHEKKGRSPKSLARLKVIRD